VYRPVHAGAVPAPRPAPGTLTGATPAVPAGAPRVPVAGVPTSTWPVQPRPATTLPTAPRRPAGPAFEQGVTR
jgi:hypothetical protein